MRSVRGRRLGGRGGRRGPLHRVALVLRVLEPRDEPLVLVAELAPHQGRLAYYHYVLQVTTNNVVNVIYGDSFNNREGNFNNILLLIKKHINKMCYIQIIITTTNNASLRNTAFHYLSLNGDGLPRRKCSRDDEVRLRLDMRWDFTCYKTAQYVSLDGALCVTQWGTTLH